MKKLLIGLFILGFNSLAIAAECEVTKMVFVKNNLTEKTLTKLRPLSDSTITFFKGKDGDVHFLASYVQTDEGPNFSTMISTGKNDPYFSSQGERYVGTVSVDGGVETRYNLICK